MTLEEFNSRIDESMEDSKNGRLIEASDLKAKIDKWN
jgi:predicted transcriptional regulator